MRSRAWAAPFWAAVACAALAGAACSGREEPGVALALTDRVGEVSRYRWVNEVTLSARVEGPEGGRVEVTGPAIEQRTRAEIYLTERLVSVDSAGVRTFESTLDSLSLSAFEAGEPVPIPRAGLLTSSRSPVRTQRTAAGAVLRVQTEDPALRWVAEMFHVANVGAQLPEHTVRVGDSWTHRLRLPVPNAGIEAQAVVESRLLEVRKEASGNEAVIDVRGTVGRLPEEGESAPASVSANGTLSGVLRFDAQAGRVVAGDYGYRIAVEVATRVGVVLRTVAEGTMTVTLVEA